MFNRQTEGSILSKSALSNPVAIRHMWRQGLLMWRQDNFFNLIISVPITAEIVKNMYETESVLGPVLL